MMNGPAMRGFALGLVSYIRTSDLYSFLHSALGGLTTGDDHTQYFLNAGRSGGQSATGGTAAGNDLTLNSTSHGTKGSIFLEALEWDGVNQRLDFGTIFNTQELLLYHSGNTRYGIGMSGGQLDIFSASNGAVTIGSVSTTDGTTYTKSWEVYSNRWRTSNVLGQTFNVYESGNSRYGFGVQAGQMLVYAEGVTGNGFAFGQMSNSDGTTFTPFVEYFPFDKYARHKNTAASASVGTESTLAFWRPVTGAVSWDQYAEIKIGRHTAPSSVEPNTRLDFALKHASNGTLSGDVTVLTLQSDGKVKIVSGWLEHPEVSAPATPGSGFFATYANANNLFAKNDGGTTFSLTRRIMQIAVTDPNGSALTTGDGKAYFRINSELNGYNITAVAAHVTTVSSSGTVDVQIANVTDTVDLLSTKITIDANEKDSSTAATAAVINTANDDVATGDEWRIDIDAAGTGAKGLIVEITFSMP